MNRAPERIDAVILCGGLGKRLRRVVHNRPKVMAEINKRPFLDSLIDKLVRHGFKRLILCTGYKGNLIKGYYGKRRTIIKILYSEENRPLGTGGALRKAEPLIHSDTFLVMNGDTICNVDLNKFLNFHFGKKALMSMVLMKLKETSDFGGVILGKDYRITGYQEKKQGKNHSLINAGIYLMEKKIFLKMPKKTRFSLEDDFFPSLPEFKCYGFINKNGFMLDIGTPQRYAQAIQLCEDNRTLKLFSEFMCYNCA